jgi:hypothetical protein
MGFFLAGLIWTKPSWADLDVGVPLGPIYQGESVRLGLEMSEIDPIKGKLFYRPIGVHYYQRLPLNFENKTFTTALLPSTAVVAPGIEYYVEIIDRSGEVITSPSADAGNNPFKLEVNESFAPAELKLVSPDVSVPFRRDTSYDQTFSVVIEAAPSDTKLMSATTTIILDNTDITNLASFSGNKITFSTALLPEAGEHTLFVNVIEPSGVAREKSWSFLVEGGPEKEHEREFYARGGLSFNYGHQLKGPSGSTGNTVSSNLNLEFGVKGDDWEATWNGINIQYIKDNPDDDLTISSGFYFTLRKGEQFFEFGDITISETSLTAPSFARRGAQAKLKWRDTEFHIFDVSTATVSGWDAGIGDSDGQVYGFSLSRPILSDKRLPVTFVYITGENQEVNGFNASGTQTSSEGDIVGIAVSHEIYGIDVEGELAGSRFDDDVADDSGDETDIAGKANLSTTIGRFSLGADYHYFGPDFASIANPNFTSDRLGFGANLGTTFGASTISVSAGRERDNVEDDSARPVVYSTTGTISYGLALAPWPSLNLSYSHSDQDSEKEPVGSNNVDNTNDTINVGLTTSGEKWNANLSGNYGKLCDRVGDLDSDIWGLQLSGNYTPFEGFSLSPSASHSKSESSGVIAETSVASLTANIPLLESYMDTDFQVSYTLNDSSDGSVDSNTLNGSLRLSLNIHEFVKRWLDFGNQETLALSFNYTRLEDDVTSAIDDDLTIFLSFNAYAPVGWSRGF